MRTDFDGTSAKQIGAGQDSWLDRVRYSADLLSPVLMTLLFAQTLAVFTSDISAFKLAGAGSGQVRESQARSVTRDTTCLQDAVPPDGQRSTSSEGARTKAAKS